MTEKLTYTVEEAGHRLGISRGLAYTLVKTGQIPSLQLGRRIVVPKAALDRMLRPATPDDEPTSK